MAVKLKKIMLLDDNKATNYIHSKFVKQYGCAKEIITFQSGYDALDYLKMLEKEYPELIFIDINMPSMDAWEFLNQYRALGHANTHNTVIILLTTSLSPLDIEKAKSVKFINDIYIKPLYLNTIDKIVTKYFSKVEENS